MNSKQLLAEARAAKHRLLTGSSTVQVRTVDGRTVQFAQAQIDALTAYIRELERLCGINRRRPFGVVW